MSHLQVEPMDGSHCGQEISDPASQAATICVESFLYRAAHRFPDVLAPRAEIDRAQTEEIYDSQTSSKYSRVDESPDRQGPSSGDPETHVTIAPGPQPPRTRGIPRGCCYFCVGLHVRGGPEIRGPGPCPGHHPAPSGHETPRSV